MLMKMELKKCRQTEKGMALITVLVFLVVLTLVGITAMRSSGMQERMAGNLMDQDVSFQNTEAAVREGENWVNGLTYLPIVATANCGVPPCQDAIWQQNSVWLNNGDFLNPLFWANSPNTRLAAAIPGVSGQAQYVVERLGTIPNSSNSLVLDYFADGIQVFRVTARGPGLTANSSTVIQSTYGKEL